MKKGKKYLESLGKVNKATAYDLKEAIELVKETSYTKFDASIEIAVKLNLDTTKVDQQLRGAIVLPKGTGKSKTVLVIAKGEAAAKAKEAGAEHVGDEDMINKIAIENFMDFDVVITTPDMMPVLGRVAKILGPKGLMPNLKTGTVTNDVEKAVNEIKKGRFEYRTDKFGNIHGAVGKVSFDVDSLEENIRFAYDVILKAKPITVKGDYVVSVFITSTMGPSVKVDLNSLTI
ncbi:MAG: 50S ribosomal protein L1 [Bacilli bacterium]